jgi:hypothetical protein
MEAERKRKEHFNVLEKVLPVSVTATRAKVL